METTDIVASIRAGENDENLRDIAEAISLRREYTALELKSRIAVGDTVQVVSPNIKPKYLRNTEWEVEKVNQKTLNCKPAPGNTQSRRYAHGIRLPLTVVEVVNSQ